MDTSPKGDPPGFVKIVDDQDKYDVTREQVAELAQNDYDDNVY